MPAVDGLMLLRWLRQTKASPNCFMPFMMFSSTSNREAVLAARDAGAHEFIAKPFSPEILSSHILALIDRPRPFIYCGSYFGPDRRREASRFDGADRRVTPEDEIQIVYANRDPTPLREGGPRVWCFRPPNKLRAKIGGAAPGETGAIDPAMLEAADEQIGQMEDDYADWVQKSIAELTAAVERCRTNPVGAYGVFKRINSIARELHAQAGMFGYPLVSLFSQSLDEYTQSEGPQDTRHIELINAHVDGIGAVIRQKVRGDGGPVGAALIDSLKQAKRQYESNAASATGKA